MSLQFRLIISELNFFFQRKPQKIPSTIVLKALEADARSGGGRALVEV